MTTITLEYRFWVEVDLPAGPHARQVAVAVDFDTDDHDHAMELAERYWPSIKPARYLDGTLKIV